MKKDNKKGWWSGLVWEVFATQKDHCT